MFLTISPDDLTQFRVAGLGYFFPWSHAVRSSKALLSGVSLPPVETALLQNLLEEVLDSFFLWFFIIRGGNASGMASASAPFKGPKCTLSSFKKHHSGLVRSGRVHPGSPAL